MALSPGLLSCERRYPAYAFHKHLPSPFYTGTSEFQQEKDAWQIVHDVSLKKSEEYPNASNFELV
jgi:hypothetical protein